MRLYLSLIYEMRNNLKVNFITRSIIKKEDSEYKNDLHID